MYNKSGIMRNAWAIRRELNVSMSEALKKAWAKAKAPKDKDVVSLLLSAGGRRWTKNGHDRIYLSRAIKNITKDDFYSGMSRKVSITYSYILDSVYYDVANSKLVYNKTPYDGWSWMNEHIENSFKAICA